VQSVIGALHAARETGALTDPETGGPRPIDADRRALRGAWLFNAARDFGFSISREEGVSLGVSGEWTSAALGSDGSAGAVVVDARGYQRLGSRHSVLAVRAAAASAWGDETVRRVFAAGSSSPAPSPGLDFGGDAIALIRGFETRDVFGDRAAVVNVDYRFPITWIERGVGTWPLFLRNLHGAVFVDGGAAWNTTLRRSDRRASAGFELSSDIVAGYSLPLTATVGVAFRDDPTRRSRGAAVFGRVGRAF
jgi:outer membrane protein assembly factor BamA